MYCVNCGVHLEDGTPFCHACGAAQKSTLRESGSANDMPMKWYKFLIYFALFAGAVLNALSGISMLTGNVYGGAAEYVYDYFEGLKALDTLVGIALIASAGLAIYTRSRLAGFHRDGPKFLLINYAAGAAIQLIYIIGASMVGIDDLNLSSYISSIATSAAMIYINMTYFKKREHLFKNL